MADEEREQGLGAGRAKRPGPTIDLTAKEVARSAPPEQPEQTEPSEMPPQTNPADTSPPFEAEPPRSSLWSSRSPRGPWLSLAAGAVGAIVILLFAWLVGFGAKPDTGPLERRIAELQARVQNLAQAQPPGVDPKRVDDLAQRVTKLEKTPPQAPPDQGMADRLGSTEVNIKALRQDVADLNRRGDELAGAIRDLRQRVAQGSADQQDVATLRQRLSALENDIRNAQGELAKQATTASDRAARLALTAIGLRATVERGDPYTAELAAMKALGGDAKLIAALEPFAMSGLPDPHALGQEIDASMPVMLKTLGATTGQTGFLDRLQANAEKLVRITPTNAPPSDDPRGILARAQTLAHSGDLDGAVDQLMRLPPEVRGPAQTWINKVEGRRAALAAARRVAADAVAVLGTTAR